MTDRQKEMLKKRAILEFLSDNPDLTMKDIDSYSLIREITVANLLPPLYFSHYTMYIHLTDGKNVIYIPKERFKVKETNHVDKNSEQTKDH